MRLSTGKQILELYELLSAMWLCVLRLDAFLPALARDNMRWLVLGEFLLQLLVVSVEAGGFDPAGDEQEGFAEGL